MAAVMDEARITSLRTEYGAALLNLALRLSDGDRGRAEDIVQETLLRAWLHPEALDGRSPLPWLFTVARRLSVDAYRARRCRPEFSQETLDWEPADDGVDGTLDSLVIAAAVAKLSAPHRRVIVELFYRDRSVSETAATLGIPPGTVKSRTFYALKALRLALEEAGVLAARLTPSVPFRGAAGSGPGAVRRPLARMMSWACRRSPACPVAVCNGRCHHLTHG